MPRSVTPTEAVVNNPVVDLRHELGLTQRSLAQVCGVSRDYIIRLEQGLFETVSPKVIAILKPDKPYRFRHRYQTWRIQQRTKLRDYYREFPPYYQPTYESDIHPFRAWREANWPDLSQVGFCILIRQNPSGLRSYETGNQRFMPSTIRRALYEIGISQALLGKLELEVGLWLTREGIN